MTNKVFLGGTYNGSKWREELKPLLTVPYYDPVVPVWNAEAQQEEWLQKNEARVRLYVITPKMTGVFSIAEVVDDSNKYPHRTLLVILTDDGGVFSTHQLQSLQATAGIVSGNGAGVAYTLDQAAEIINELCTE